MNSEPRKDVSAVCLLVTNLDAPTGGIQKRTRTIMRELSGRGVSVFVCARNYYGLARDESGGGATVHRSPVAGGSMALNGVLYLADTLRWLVRNRKRYDVIHCQQMFGPTMAAAVSSILIHKPIVTGVTTAGSFSEVEAVRQMPLAGLRLRLIRRVSRWVALTRQMKAELESIGIPSERIDVIPNSTDIPPAAAFEPETRLEMRRKLGLEYARIAVCAGRLSEEKNIDVLIRAWKRVLERHPDAHLLILGEGGNYRNVEAELRQMTKDLELESAVHFLGHVDNAKEYILASDAFVLPSRTEGMSNALVEAFACGTAIIVTNIEANRELCETDVNSILVPVGDEAKLADALTAVFSAPELQTRIGKAAREKAEAVLSTERMISAYLETYRRAIGLPR